jgi:hypothetical protein
MDNPANARQRPKPKTDKIAAGEQVKEFLKKIKGA